MSKQKRDNTMWNENDNLSLITADFNTLHGLAVESKEESLKKLADKALSSYETWCAMQDDCGRLIKEAASKLISKTQSDELLEKSKEKRVVFMKLRLVFISCLSAIISELTAKKIVVPELVSSFAASGEVTSPAVQAKKKAPAKKKAK